jgi:hypothetical protein
MFFSKNDGMDLVAFLQQKPISKVKLIIVRMPMIELLIQPVRILTP